MEAETAPNIEQMRAVIREELSSIIVDALKQNGGTIYLDTPEAAEYLGVSPQFLEGARHRGDGPPYSRLVRRVKYTRDDLDNWMLKRRLDPEAA